MLEFASCSWRDLMWRIRNGQLDCR